MRTVRQVIELFGGAAALAAKLGNIQKNRVSTWAWRDRFPAAQHITLIRLAEEEGLEIPEKEITRNVLN